jgi:peptidoglycan/LPS O-acetylase OafA/YrhL
VARDGLPRHDLTLLDGLRAVAALMVLTTHVGFQTGSVLRGAWGMALARLDLGVALFFVLSGFLLFRSWVAAAAERRSDPSTRRYLVRRAVRILPAYWVVLLVALLTTAAGTSASAAAVNTALLQVYRGPLLPGLTQTWSLSTEVAFYVVLPLVAAQVARLGCSERGPRRVAILLAAVAVGAWVWTAFAAAGVLPRVATAWLPGHADWFAAGMGLAVLEHEARRGGRAARVAAETAAHPWTLLALALTLFWLAATPVGGPATLAPVAPASAAAKEGIYAVVAALLVWVAVGAHGRGGAVEAVLGHPAAQWCGRVSYGVFLWHLLVLAAVFDVLHVELFSGSFWSVWLLTVVGSLAVATVSWTVLEEPLLRRVHRPSATATRDLAETVGSPAEPPTPPRPVRR